MLWSSVAAAQDVSFAALTRELAALDPKDLRTAQSTLERYRDEVATTRALLNGYSSELSTAIAACDEVLGGLQVFSGDLTRQHEVLEASLTDAQNRLSVAIQDEANFQTEITGVQASIDAAQASLREHQKKVDQLKKWFWVPGYGQFLAVRELVDNDSNRIGDLQRQIANLVQEENSAVQRAKAAEALRAALIARLSRADVEESVLEAAMADLNRRVGDLRILDSNLHEASIGLDPLQNAMDISLELNADLFELALEDARAQLSATGAAAQIGLDPDVTASFAVALDQFVGDLEDGVAAAHLHANDCAEPGDPNDRDPVSCEKPRFPYFVSEPSDVCRFRYENPPGCPPQAASAEPLTTISAGAVTDLDNRNLVGAARCVSDEAIFLGVASTPDHCDSACTDNTVCRYWSMYLDDSWLPGAQGECWGGGDKLEPDLEELDWAGVVSGGNPCGIGRYEC
ncbi:MAG: hypothetical protein AAGF94_08540 [Pseudomonadota bacterium]